MPKEQPKKEVGQKPEFKVCILKGEGQGLDEVCAFWARNSKAGKQYWSGKMTKTVTLAEGTFVNLFKQ